MFSSVWPVCCAGQNDNTEEWHAGLLWAVCWSLSDHWCRVKNLGLILRTYTCSCIVFTWLISAIIERIHFFAVSAHTVNENINVDTNTKSHQSHLFVLSKLKTTCFNLHKIPTCLWSRSFWNILTDTAMLLLLPVWIIIIIRFKQSLKM